MGALIYLVGPEHLSSGVLKAGAFFRNIEKSKDLMTFKPIQ